MVRPKHVVHKTRWNRRGEVCASGDVMLKDPKPSKYSHCATVAAIYELTADRNGIGNAQSPLYAVPVPMI
jgi:hypothetical protein